ncbi:hypothetical protein PFAG_04224 [Plasmodium falciparum Santa Lucia]|uniref:Uncharacterized protein n=1 Tax=Plasmodium falciparum Santa Lucia TaxID=478859 RepID=W7FV02_PLAFA|nr:hypothetical protein PFAG_04224 [Plasmodium falciparum Santa Lucia]
MHIIDITNKICYYFNYIKQFTINIVFCYYSISYDNNSMHNKKKIIIKIKNTTEHIYNIKNIVVHMRTDLTVTLYVINNKSLHFVNE